MSADVLERIERDLDRIGNELWNIDGPDDCRDALLKKLSSLKAQVEVQIALQATASLLRREPPHKALPKQQATKIKHLVRFVFRKDSRGGSRHKQLRDLDCDTLKFCGLAYTTEEITKMDDMKFSILRSGAAEFVHRRGLPRLLYRTDVDKAVNAKFEDPDDDGSFEKFFQGTQYVSEQD